MNIAMNEEFSPLVSIVIPVYNGADYLGEAIDSALMQTYGNIEVIVVNDGSNDETDAIARSYGDKIRYYSKKNGGVATALNLGIENMRGEYFSWLSHDDIYMPEKIELQINKLKNIKNKETILYGDVKYIDCNSAEIGFRILHEKHHHDLLNNPIYPLLNGLVHGCTLLLKKSLFDRYGKFSENLKTVQDYWLWFDIFRKNELLYMEHVLIASREHAAQGSKSLSHIAAVEQKILWDKLINDLTVHEINKIIAIQAKPIAVSAKEAAVSLRFSEKKILSAVFNANAENAFTVVDLKWVFSNLPQWRLRPAFLQKMQHVICGKISIASAYLLLQKLQKYLQPKTILLFEPNPYHGETLCGYVKYFNDLGYNVHVVANKKIQHENPFCRYSGAVKCFYAKIDINFLKYFLSNIEILNKYDLCLIQSSIYYEYGIPTLLHLLIEQEKLPQARFVEHSAKNIALAGEEYLLDEQKIWTILPREYNNKQTVCVNPHFFGDVSDARRDKDIIRFAAIGVIHKEYRAHNQLEGAIKKIKGLGINNFIITVIGSGEMEELPESCLQHVEFLGRVQFNVLYDYLERSSFLLFLLDPNQNAHQRYLNDLVTGSLQLSLGFGAIPVIDEYFMPSLLLSDSCVVRYKNGNLADGMYHALKLNEDEYRAKQDSILKLAHKIYSYSLSGVKNAL